MLSTFESALLDRHLTGCPSCRAFSASASAQTRLVRAAALEEPSRPVEIEIPWSPARTARRNAGGILAGAMAAAAAAVTVLGLGQHSGSLQPSPSASAAGGPALVVVAAAPNPSMKQSVEVPRLRVRPASIADGPVRGMFSQPA
jgi:predicted anti-sigma-YlaC factor YlaD